MAKAWWGSSREVVEPILFVSSSCSSHKCTRSYGQPSVTTFAHQTSTVLLVAFRSQVLSSSLHPPLPFSSQRCGSSSECQISSNTRPSPCPGWSSECLVFACPESCPSNSTRPCLPKDSSSKDPSSTAVNHYHTYSSIGWLKDSL